MSQKWLTYNEVKEDLFRGKYYLGRQGDLLFVKAGRAVSVAQANIDKYFDDNGPAYVGFDNCLFQELSDEKRQLFHKYGSVKFWDHIDDDGNIF